VRRPGRRAGWRAALVPVLVALAPAGGAAAPDCIVLEDFAGSRERAFPSEWTVRKEAGRAVYAVWMENGLRFLRATALNVGIQAARAREWDLGEYPVLAWRWRPRRFPRGANEQTGKNDSVLAVYAVFPYSSFAVKSLKYVWSEKVPRGTPLESSRGLTQVLVLESGPAAGAAWVEERVDLAADYRRRFHDTALARPAGIAVLTDSDDTVSYAEGDYADFLACRR
jgi:hypothetical protein